MSAKLSTESVSSTDRALPDLKTSGQLMLHHQPLPTSLQSDFLPDEILLSLTQRAVTRQELKPPMKLKTKLSSPANVWHFSGRREKMKHLTEHTPCICGAGRDVSFLYDIPPKEDSLPLQPRLDDPSAVRIRSRQQKRNKNQESIHLPDTLIPKEFHLVKSKGVIGLEYHDETFSTKTEDHEKHLTVFPSMNPVSRFEVLQLKRTMNDMLRLAGIDDEMHLEEAGPTQMHRLLELVKKEQDIYNIIFHELIRQTTVECVERGELLSNLRQRYSSLLARIPEQVKDLHDEVVAQRALDRRLTEELVRFKTSIAILTKELNEVKQHDEALSKEVLLTRDELCSALEDSKRNADLLNEYHSLYELQRLRLEKQVELLSDEKELWSSATYCMAMRVTEEYALVTARRLHVAEKSWNQIARHFTLLLTEADTSSLAQLQSFVNEWREKVEIFAANLMKRETQTSQALDFVAKSIRQFQENFDEKYLSDEGHLIHGPSATEVEEICESLLLWEKYINLEVESFGGDVMLAMQDDLGYMRRLVRKWTDLAMSVFLRHSKTNLADPDAVPEEVQEMNRVNAILDQVVVQLTVRLVGDNGVAQGMLSIQSIMESWTTRLKVAVNMQTKPLPESEWSRLYALLDDWLQLVQETKQCIGQVYSPDSPDPIPTARLEVTSVVNEIHKWASTTVSAVDSEDSRRMEAVSHLHTSMVHWMVQVLLRISPDHPSSTPQSHKVSLLASATPEEIMRNGSILFERLHEFTNALIKSCSAIVWEMTQQKVELREENPDAETIELKKLEAECTEWIETAKLLLNEMISGNVLIEPRESPPISAEVDRELMLAAKGFRLLEEEDEDNGDFFLAASAAPVPPGGSGIQSLLNMDYLSRSQQPHQIEGIGQDRNTHARALLQDEKHPPREASFGFDLRQAVATPDAEQAYEAIAVVQKLQKQIKEAEHHAQLAETEAMASELKLAEALDVIRAHEAKIASLEKDLEKVIAEQHDQDPLPQLLFRKPSVEETKEVAKIDISGAASVSTAKSPKAPTGKATVKRGGGQTTRRGGAH